MYILTYIDDKDHPKFKLPADIESPERASAPVFNKPDIPLDDSPSTPKKTKSSEVLKIVSPLSPSPLKTKITFNPPDPEIDDSFEGPGTNPDSSLPFMPSRAQSTPAVYAAPHTQPAAEFKAYSLDDDLASTAQALINDNRAPLLPISAVFNDDDDFATMTQMARCPMCNKPVDPADIRAFGEMNTRMQEKFCRSHQKKTAGEEWDLKGYPTIDWERLDSRISKHHSYIKKLINGAESHYRTAFTETINAGKDRSLLKMTSNLTPGYYGSRGLRAMSENVMQKFTPLLKTRTVKDRLISARGPIPFVQSVLVPEITVILIMEDMDVDIGEAREILSESCTIGDLVNEEIRDVFKRRVDDSEDESESDG
jgi:RTC4-like domain